MWPIQMQLTDISGTTHLINAECLFIETPLKVGLFSWNFLKYHKHKYIYNDNSTLLALKLKHAKTHKYYHFHLENRDKNNVSFPVLSNIHEIQLIKNVPQKVMLRGNLPPGNYTYGGQSIVPGIIRVK